MKSACILANALLQECVKDIQFNSLLPKEDKDLLGIRQLSVEAEEF
jgi:hypothetical protein